MPSTWARSTWAARRGLGEQLVDHVETSPLLGSSRQLGQVGIGGGRRLQYPKHVTGTGQDSPHRASDPAPAQEMPPPGEPDIPRILRTIEPYHAEIVGPPLPEAG